MTRRQFWVSTMIGTLAARLRAQAPLAVTAWIKENAVPLKTVEAGNGFGDMQPLKKLIGDARIVAMGEATHGTREFFQFKHRMLEFLVEQMGFTVFGIEANWPESLALNEYVLTGKGDPKQGLRDLYFWTWDTEEVLAMIEWMRRYNADGSHPRKVKFYGFDMQVPSVAIARVTEFLAKVDSQGSRETAELLNPLDTTDKMMAYTTQPEALRKKTAAAIAGLEGSFDQYKSKSSLTEWTLARQHLRIVAQAEAMLATPLGGLTVRDKAMAENVKWLLDQEGRDAKIMLWAHNGHVSTTPQPGTPQPMGSHLRKEFGDQMVVFGFAFNQGSFRAVEPDKGMRTFTVGPAPENSLDQALASAGMPLFALDVRHPPEPVVKWLADARGSRSIGAVFNDGMANTTAGLNPARSFNSLIFVEKTNPSRPLP